jgi:hypothetical protein
MTNCFFANLVTWKDPNLSAAFLTAGNLGVLILLLSGDAASWVLFALVFGVLPIGLIARLTGLDQQVRSYLTRAPADQDKSTPSYYESHIVSQLTSIGLIRVGVYFVILARLFDMVGVAGTIWVVGNTVMLVPMLLWRFGPVAVEELQSRVNIGGLSKMVSSSVHSGLDTIASFGPMAPAVSGGILAFLAVIIASYLATSSTLLVANMTLIGYGLILTFALLPLSVVERSVTALVPSASAIETMSDRVQLTSVCKRITDLVMWNNYKNSVIAFASLYVFYFISKFVGVVIPLALGTGCFAAFTLTPTTLKEKALAELDKTIQQVRTSVVGPIQSVIGTPPKASTPAEAAAPSSPASSPLVVSPGLEKHVQPVSPRSSPKKSPKSPKSQAKETVKEVHPLGDE